MVMIMIMITRLRPGLVLGDCSAQRGLGPHASSQYCRQVAFDLGEFENRFAEHPLSSLMIDVRVIMRVTVRDNFVTCSSEINFTR